MKVKLPRFECQRCGHKWTPRNEEQPLRCAFCKSPYWRKAAVSPSVRQGKHSEECVGCKERR